MHSLKFGVLEKEIKTLIIFDRDGTLNVDHGYSFKINDLQLTMFARSIKSFFEDYYFAAAIASNQSGIARGLFSVRDFDLFTSTLIHEIDPHLRNFFLAVACPHLPTHECDCRKPGTAMIDAIIKEHAFEKVMMVGNSNSDRLTAFNSSIEYIDCNKIDAYEELKEWVVANCDYQ
jgi:D-glycero-D-manno-heptose 1,7-bisphosphate phosphatase